MSALDSARISPTAHYTAYVWYRNGLSHPALASRTGAALHAALRPFNLFYERFTDRVSLDVMLLARHRVLDHLLEEAVSSGRVGQVVEVAAGFSPRGFRFAQRFPQLTYVEADLPEQAEAKRRLLDEAALRGPRHHVVALDALADDGPASLTGAVAPLLDGKAGTALITEGLLGYFDRAAVEGMFRRFARFLSAYPQGDYYSDLNLSREVDGMRAAAGFRWLLERFARGKVHLHWGEAHEAEAALRAAGFGRAEVRRADEFTGVDIPQPERRHFIHLIDASVKP